MNRRHKVCRGNSVSNYNKVSIEKVQVLDLLSFVTYVNDIIPSIKSEKTAYFVDDTVINQKNVVKKISRIKTSK